MDHTGKAEEDGATGRPASTVESADSQPGIAEPGLEEVLTVVFGISSSELAVCRCVMELGETTTARTAEELEVDRSLVSRHLNHLTSLGVLEKDRRLRRSGGDVYVYRPNAIRKVREAFARRLQDWTDEAERQIESLTREKVAAIPDESSKADKVIFADS